ncbi:hypothetical protein ACQPZF_30190 [Actinosynnema sp. CS-041913]|uniref:hypothetical protein n=1 Tax=Actinosynnema sp. CS-041913 TaxID=3239917 RepID=UPI003D91124E
MSLGERLDAIRAKATDDGVAVTVDLHGKLVDLTFAKEAFAQRPETLAATIRRLAEQATNDALTHGIAAVSESTSILQKILRNDTTAEEPQSKVTSTYAGLVSSRER